jgi:photoactive yellow protein
MTAAPDFSMPGLAVAVDGLSIEQLNQLPFGAIKLDAQGAVQHYNATEARLSGRGGRPTVGKMFFADVAPCMDNEYFKGRIDKALKAGTLDLSFTFVGDFSDRERELTVRVQSSKDGGMWIFHQRPDGAA